MTFWLARHARPLVVEGTCYGALDVPADADATALAAEALRDLLPRESTVRFSPLQRCAQLAAALSARRPDLVPQRDPRLREMDFGRWEGQAWQAIEPSELAAWTDDFARHRAGGGENVQGFMQRVDEAWRALERRPTLWITHAGVIRAASLLASGRRRIERADEWPADGPAYGAWTQVARPDEVMAPNA